MSHNEEIVDKDYRNRRGPAGHVKNSKAVAHYRGFRHNDNDVSPRSAKATNSPFYNKDQDHEQFRHRGRDIKGVTHMPREPNSPSPTRLSEIDYDSEDNLIVKVADEYIGRRKKTTYAKETFEQFRARLERIEAKAKLLRRQNGGPEADARFEEEWWKTHTKRDDIPFQQSRSGSRRRHEDADAGASDYQNWNENLNDTHSSPKALYKVLGCTPSSTPAEIYKQYFKKAFLFHPDRNENQSAEDLAKWNEIRRAGVVLRDSDNKARYDRTGDSDTRWLNTQQCMNPYFV